MSALSINTGEGEGKGEEMRRVAQDPSICSGAEQRWRKHERKEGDRLTWLQRMPNLLRPLGKVANF